MTAPIAHGYPDWTRQTPASDVLFVREVGTLSTGGVTRGPFFVGATTALGLYVEAVGTGHQVHLDFYADVAGTQYLGTQSLDLARGGAFFRGAIRTLGPWVRITITPFAAGNTFNLSAWAAPSPGTIFGNATESVLINTSQAIGIGATITLDANRLHPGVAHLYVAQRAGTFTANAYTVDFAGSRASIIGRVMAAGEYFSEMIALGSGTPEIEVTNSSGAGSTIDVRLVAVPNLTG